MQEAAVELYGRGIERKTAAKMLADLMYGDRKTWDRPRRVARARAVLERWEKEPWFRDRLWAMTVVNTDLQTPAVMAGVVKQAKRGKVDAAKLALAVARRHEDKEHGAQANVQVVFAQLPRPDREVPVIEGTVVAEED